MQRWQMLSFRKTTSYPFDKKRLYLQQLFAKKRKWIRYNIRDIDSGEALRELDLLESMILDYQNKGKDGLMAEAPKLQRTHQATMSGAGDCSLCGKHAHELLDIGSSGHGFTRLWICYDCLHEEYYTLRAIRKLRLDRIANSTNKGNE